MKAINAMLKSHKLSCITRRKGNFVCSCGRDQAAAELAAIQARIEKLAEYTERLRKAITELETLKPRTFTEGSRIDGKIDGVKIALSYFEEMTR